MLIVVFVVGIYLNKRAEYVSDTARLQGVANIIDICAKW